MTVFMEKTAKYGDLLTICPRSICHKFKPMPTNDCVLHPNRIDIWQYPLHETWDNAESIINAEEQDRAARFHFARHKRRFTCAHAYLRIILSRYLKNKNPQALEFSENKYGKPQIIANNHNLQFNLSHSGEFAVLAVGQNFPLGVDLEVFSGREYLNLGGYMFSEKEQQALKKIPPRMRALTFFNIWAQKEAFIKACGMGLSYPTQDFSVPHLSCNNAKVMDNKHNQEWYITSFKPTITSCGAICYTANVTDFRYIILENRLELN